MKSPSFAAEWIELKEQERSIIERRREIEDLILASFEISEKLNGTCNLKMTGYKVKVVGRMTQKVDSDLLQELAAENGMSDLLPDLFRWKAEINKKKWDDVDPKITSVLSGAITTTPSRPSFSITIED